MTLITDDEKCFIRVFIKSDLFPLYDTRRIHHGYVHIFLRRFSWHANFNFEQRVLVHNG